MSPKMMILIIKVIKLDKSPIVRAFAMRILYHPPSEQWPTRPELRIEYMHAIRKRESEISYDVRQSIDDLIGRDLLEIDERTKWISFR